MCGIAGFWQKDISKENQMNSLKDMLASFAYRGPDDMGYYQNDRGLGLAHKRLSIIDLTNSGRQPMYSDDGDIVIVFNGEIYNYKEVAVDLAANYGITFKSNSDTEVIIKAYQVYGKDFVSYLNGMFAIAIWDGKSEELFIARDRIGIKPIYYYFNDGFFAFASEIKALLKLPQIKKTPNINAIIKYNTLSFQLNEETWYEKIFLLEPGCTLSVTHQGVVKNSYWRPIININYKRSYADTVNELKYLIENAINIHQISDVPVGAHLSGGVDSSTIVAFVSKSNKNLHTFSSTFKSMGVKFDESNEINYMKNHFGTHHHQITANGNEVELMLDSMITSLDEPIAGPATIPMYFINKLIHQAGIKVVNGGQGVDELFGGYPPYFNTGVRNLIKMIKMRKHVPTSELPYIPLYIDKYLKGRNFTAKSTTQDIWKNTEMKTNTINLYNQITNNLQEDLLPFEQMMIMDLKFYLPALLHQEDRMSMNWSIESRVPFLDYRLVEYALTIPSYFKIRKGITKAVFRDAVKDLVPPLILNNKIKRGYPTPISYWLQNELKYRLINLNKGNLFSLNLFDETTVKLMIDEHLNMRKDHSAVLWKLLCTEIWFKNNFC